MSVLRKNWFFSVVLFFLASVFWSSVSCAEVQANSNPARQDEIVTKIVIKGNRTVSSDAVLNFMSIKTGTSLTPAIIAANIKSIYASTYFQDVKFERGPNGELIVSVVEKPTVNDVLFEGFGIVSVSSIKDKMLTKKYNIVDEKKLSEDLRTIEQAYVEKGYYLSKVTYTLAPTTPGVVNVVFKVKENFPITVRSVNLLNNSFFNDAELQTFMGTRPFGWTSFFSSAGLYRDEFTIGDQQNLTYFYRDNGFAEATVAAPISNLDKTERDISVSFYIDEGERFNIGKITITGDLIESESELKEKLSLKEGALYRISKFNSDMQLFKVIYGDKGYAFAYVYPTFNVDRVNRTYDITYNVTKGEKAYFGKINVEGNIKTRDNVIRRALKISEGRIFNATALLKSKANVEKTGLFESVHLLQEPDENTHVMNVKVLIKEKSTGSLQASIGASPNTTNGSNGIYYFVQGQYNERNITGRAYSVGANVQISPNQNPQEASKINYSLGLNFTNPSIYDSPWSFTIYGNYSYLVQSVTSSVAVSNSYLSTRTRSFGFNVGRQIFIENLRFGLGYSYSATQSDPSIPLTAKFYPSGAVEKISQFLIYDGTDNAFEPTSGIYLSATHAFGVRITAGEYKFGSLSGLAAYYYPVPFTDTFKTNFRVGLQSRYVYQLTESQSVPYWERLWLGNAYYMKGYSNPGELISPKIPVTISPITGQTINLTYGGNRSYYGSIEYFIPVIPDAGLRFVTFAEAGTVLDDSDKFDLQNIKYDVGFGFRWKTPIAPFRFEWAFPMVNGQLGQAHFVFTIGTDSFNGGM